MNITELQNQIADKLVQELEAKQRITPRILLGLGRIHIFCLVAKKVHPKTIGLIVRESVADYAKQTIQKHIGVDNLKVNHVNTDYIINDRQQLQ